MFQEIVIENIPDDVFERLVMWAQAEGRTVEDMVRDWLVKAAERETALQAIEQRSSRSGG